jgi:hypothetical protein
MVEWACQKPNWWFGIHDYGFDSWFILLSISFSRTFEIVGIRLIGRYDVTSAGFLPGFKIIMIWAILSGCGQ